MSNNGHNAPVLAVCAQAKATGEADSSMPGRVTTLPPAPSLERFNTLKNKLQNVDEYLHALQVRLDDISVQLELEIEALQDTQRAETARVARKLKQWEMR